MDPILAAFGLVFDPFVLAVIGVSAVFGRFVGAMPGLTATMATALLVPVTFCMPPVPALGAIVTATAMAIFAGDIPAAMLRMPGTPASATVGNSGAAGERVPLPTASARSLPARACAIIAGMLENMSCTWPAMRSAEAGPPPR
jgi:TctA family transporter